MYTHKLIRAVSLMDAGFRYDNDDFSAEEWLDISRVRRVLYPDRPFCPFVMRK